MKVEVSIVNATENYSVCAEVKDWNICENTAEVYAVALKEYGRCVSKIYVDNPDNEAIHVGWVFQKRVQYEDCEKTYLQETWIIPLKKYEIKYIKEYAIS